MNVDESRLSVPMVVGGETGQSNKWVDLEKLLNRNGPLAHPDFEPGPQVLEFVQKTIKVLVIGAGGLGCELLKDLALCGFQNIDVIDMDTIDLSNLNRQFLFRIKDIGKPKANVAAEFINNRIEGCCVKPHFCKIQDKDDEFYQGFHLIVCGLDSVIARRWINGLLVSLLDYDEDGNVDPSTIIPMVDGGTEAFKGNARVIIPGITACIECTLDLFPPQVNYPMCTIASTPRLPEHCIEYANVFQWPEEKPFGDEVVVDGDNPHHIKWIYDKALDRSKEYSIKGVTYRLTQGVVKHIIPAVASTNAVIAAVCALEVFKLATNCCNPLNNYLVFNDSDGLYTYTFEAEKKDDCSACSRVPQRLTFSDDDTLQVLLDYLVENQMYQMKAPGITTSINGKNKTLYMQSVPSIEEMTRPNLEKKLKDLGINEGHEIAVADSTSPKPIIFQIYYNTKMDQGEI